MKAKERATAEKWSSVESEKAQLSAKEQAARAAVQSAQGAVLRVQQGGHLVAEDLSAAQAKKTAYLTWALRHSIMADNIKQKGMLNILQKETRETADSQKRSLTASEQVKILYTRY